MSWEDTLPKQLCPSCVEVIEAAYDLRKLAEQSDRTLRSYISGSLVPVKIETEVDIKSEEEDEVDSKSVKNEPTHLEEQTEQTEAAMPPEPIIIKTEKTQRQATKDLSKEFQCFYCGTKVSTKRALRIHMRDHTSERLKHCEKCNKGFVKDSHLQRHLKQHGEVRKCPYCGSKFDMFKTYRLHINENHADQVEA